jgi:hypothetical protein
MKTFKSPVCSIVAAAALALCAFSAKAQTPIGVVTNFSSLSVALTIKTNAETISGTHVTFQIKTQTLANKNILSLLQNPEFANETFPKGAQLVVGWDQEWNGAVLVVDKTGTNVLYNATTGNQNATFMVNYFDYPGTWSENFNGNNPGSEQYTIYNNGYFELYDTTQNIELWAYGASTENFDLNWNKEGVDTTWSDTETYDPQMAAVTFEGANADATLSGTINANGHGKGAPFALLPKL